MPSRTVEEYLQLPYTTEITRDNNPENPGWVAQVVELPGCFTQADTFEELEGMIEDAMRSWITTALEDGQPIPEPREDERYSGKFIVRIPRSLHRQLAEQAEREEISLNQFVGTLLAGAVGFPTKEYSGRQSINKDEIRAWIHEAVQRALHDVAFQSSFLPPEPADKGISGGLWGNSKVVVTEQIEMDIQQWTETPEVEPKTELNSFVLPFLNK